MSVIHTVGEARSSKQSLQLAGADYSVATVPRSFLQMVHAPNLDRIFLMDNAMRRSMLVRKYLLDDYDEQIVNDPAFERFFSANLGLERFYFLPTGYRQTGNSVSLTQTDSTGRTVKLSLDLAKLKATLPSGGVVPFSFHRVNYQSGKLRRDPIPPNPEAKYHAIQFTYPWETRDKGFVLLNTWLFLHDDLFHSTVVQGFVFEDLDPELFEPVHLSPWAKIYRVKR